MGSPRRCRERGCIGTTRRSEGKGRWRLCRVCAHNTRSRDKHVRTMSSDFHRPSRARKAKSTGFLPPTMITSPQPPLALYTPPSSILKNPSKRRDKSSATDMGPRENHAT